MKFWCLDKAALTYWVTMHCLWPFDWPNRRMCEFWSKVFGVRLPEMPHRFVKSIFLPPCRVSTQWLGSSKWLARGGRRSRCVHFCAMHSQCLPKTVLQSTFETSVRSSFIRPRQSGAYWGLEYMDARAWGGSSTSGDSIVRKKSPRGSENDILPSAR